MWDEDRIAYLYFWSYQRNEETRLVKDFLSKSQEWKIPNSTTSGRKSMGGCREGEKEVLNVVCVKCGDKLRL